MGNLTKSMRMSLALAGALMLGACSDDDSSSSGGGGGSVANNCASACAKADSLACSGDTGDCTTQCTMEASEVEGCKASYEALVACGAARPASDWECDADDEANLKDGVCSSEFDAVVSCAIANAGSGGSGGGGGACPFTEDGECDEPDFCPVGTDSVDCGS